jgi:hypothetical protein
MRPARTEPGMERTAGYDRASMAAARQEEPVVGGVNAPWPEPEPVRVPEIQEQAFAAEIDESARQPAIREHVVQADVHEEARVRDKEPESGTTAIEISSGASRSEPDFATAEREPAVEETLAERTAPLPPSFKLPPDLVQVETSADRVQRAQNDTNADNEGRIEGRPRRPKPTEEQLPSEPLVQVETRH